MDEDDLLGFDFSAEDWCQTCKSLRQELDQLRSEKSLNTGIETLKEKIIQTDKLIKSYNKKCQEHDVQTKKLDDTKKQLEITQRDKETLAGQLKNALQDVEPLRMENEKFKTKLQSQEKKILDLQNGIEGQKVLVSQLGQLKKEQEAEIDKLKETKGELQNMLKDYKDKNKSAKKVKEKDKSGQVDALKLDVASLESAKSDLEAETNTLKAENGRLKAKYEARDKQCEDLAEKLAECQRLLAQAGQTATSEPPRKVASSDTLRKVAINNINKTNLEMPFIPLSPKKPLTPRSRVLTPEKSRPRSPLHKTSRPISPLVEDKKKFTRGRRLKGGSLFDTDSSSSDEDLDHIFYKLGLQDRQGKDIDPTFITPLPSMVSPLPGTPRPQVASSGSESDIDDVHTYDVMSGNESDDAKLLEDRLLSKSPEKVAKTSQAPQPGEPKQNAFFKSIADDSSENAAKMDQSGDSDKDLPFQHLKSPEIMHKLHKQNTGSFEVDPNAPGLEADVSSGNESESSSTSRPFSVRPGHAPFDDVFDNSGSDTRSRGNTPKTSPRAKSLAKLTPIVEDVKTALDCANNNDEIKKGNLNHEDKQSPDKNKEIDNIEASDSIDGIEMPPPVKRIASLPCDISKSKSSALRRSPRIRSISGCSSDENCPARILNTSGNTDQTPAPNKRQTRSHSTPDNAQRITRSNSTPDRATRTTRSNSYQEIADKNSTLELTERNLQTDCTLENRDAKHNSKSTSPKGGARKSPSESAYLKSDDKNKTPDDAGDRHLKGIKILDNVIKVNEKGTDMSKYISKEEPKTSQNIVNTPKRLTRKSIEDIDLNTRGNDAQTSDINSLDETDYTDPLAKPKRIARTANVPQVGHDMKSPLESIKSPPLTLKSPVSTLKSPVSTLKSPVSTLKSSISTVKSPIAMNDSSETNSNKSKKQTTSAKADVENQSQAIESKVDDQKETVDMVTHILNMGSSLPIGQPTDSPKKGGDRPGDWPKGSSVKCLNQSPKTLAESKSDKEEHNSESEDINKTPLSTLGQPKSSSTISQQGQPKSIDEVIDSNQKTTPSDDATAENNHANVLNGGSIAKKNVVDKATKSDAPKGKLNRQSLIDSHLNENNVQPSNDSGEKISLDTKHDIEGETYLDESSKMSSAENNVNTSGGADALLDITDSNAKLDDNVDMATNRSDDVDKEVKMDTSNENAEKVSTDISVKTSSVDSERDTQGIESENAPCVQNKELEIPRDENSEINENIDEQVGESIPDPQSYLLENTDECDNVVENERRKDYDKIPVHDNVDEHDHKEAHDSLEIHDDSAVHDRADQHDNTTEHDILDEHDNSAVHDNSSNSSISSNESSLKDEIKSIVAQGQASTSNVFRPISEDSSHGTQSASAPVSGVNIFPDIPTTTTRSVSPYIRPVSVNSISPNAGETMPVSPLPESPIKEAPPPLSPLSHSPILSQPIFATPSIVSPLSPTPGRSLISPLSPTRESNLISPLDPNLPMSPTQDSNLPLSPLCNSDDSLFGFSEDELLNPVSPLPPSPCPGTRVTPTPRGTVSARARATPSPKPGTVRMISMQKKLAQKSLGFSSYLAPGGMVKLGNGRQAHPTPGVNDKRAPPSGPSKKGKSADGKGKRSKVNDSNPDIRQVNLASNSSGIHRNVPQSNSNLSKSRILKESNATLNESLTSKLKKPELTNLTKKPIKSQQQIKSPNESENLKSTDSKPGAVISRKRSCDGEVKSDKNVAKTSKVGTDMNNDEPRNKLKRGDSKKSDTNSAISDNTCDIGALNESVNSSKVLLNSETQHTGDINVNNPLKQCATSNVATESATIKSQGAHSQNRTQYGAQKPNTTSNSALKQCSTSHSEHKQNDKQRGNQKQDSQINSQKQRISASATTETPHSTAFGDLEMVGSSSKTVAKQSGRKRHLAPHDNEIYIPIKKMADKPVSESPENPEYLEELDKEIIYWCTLSRNTAEETAEKILKLSVTVLSIAQKFLERLMGYSTAGLTLATIKSCVEVRGINPNEKPILSDKEMKMFELVLVFEQKKTGFIQILLAVISEKLLDRYTKSVFKESLGRIFSVLCRHLGDIERVRVLAYDILLLKTWNLPKFTVLLGIAAGWPLVFAKRTATQGPLLDTMEHIIFPQLIGRKHASV